MTAETDLLPLPEVKLWRAMKDRNGNVGYSDKPDPKYSESGGTDSLTWVRLNDHTAAMQSYARANLAELQREVEGLRAEMGRLRQLVNGGRGPLPAGAVAWLDMSPGEASLAFDKKSDSNRANKRRVMELFHRLSAGYYPLYLEPQADRAERLAGALRSFVGAAYHVCRTIDPRGYRWSEAYLDQALAEALAALDQENDDAN